MPALPPFQQLLDRHSRDVLAYLTAIVGADEAEDCFQETYLAALRTYEGLGNGSNLRGWLFTIANRKAIDVHRKRAKAPTPIGPPEEVAILTETLAMAIQMPESVAFEGLNADGEPAGLDHDEIWSEVARLPPKQRSAVTLRFAGDLSHREIGEAIGCTEAAARRNVHEGLKRLREVAE